MPFGVPMEWNQPDENHDHTNCYVFINDATSRNLFQLKDFQYRSVPSDVLPKPHSGDVPVTKRSSLQIANMFTFVGVALPDAPSNPGPSLSRINPTEVLTEELQKYNLLAEGISASSFRTRNSCFKMFFTDDSENKQSGKQFLNRV